MNLRKTFIVICLIPLLAWSQDSLNIDIIGSICYWDETEDAFCQGNYVYTACGEGGLRIIDVTDVWDPIELGFYDSPGYAKGVFKSGDYVYLADDWMGLRIIDVSIPQSPMEIASYEDFTSAKMVLVEDDLAFTIFTYSLKIFDVSDPAAPTLLGEYFTPYEAYGVDIQGDYAYFTDYYWISSQNYGGYLRVLDISDLENPLEVGNYLTEGLAYCVKVDGDYAYVADQQYGLTVFDISLPSAPDSITYADINNINDMEKMGDYIFCGHGFSSFSVIDVSYQSPQYLTGFSVGGFISGISVENFYAYLAASDAGMVIVDVIQPSNPSIVGSLNMPGQSTALSVTGDILCEVGMERGLRLLDISDPAQPVIIGYYAGLEYGYNVTSTATHAYVANESLKVFLIEDPLNISELGYYKAPLVSVQDVDYDNGYTYIAGGYGGFRVVDVSDPSDPTEVGACSTVGYAIRLDVQGEYAYVANMDGGLRIINVSDPANPFEAGYFNDNFADVMDVKAQGLYAYVTYWFHGLGVIDVSDPANPIRVGLYDDALQAQTVDIQGAYAVLGCLSDGVYVIDVSNPNNPFPAGYNTGTGSCSSALFAGGYLCSAEGDYFAVYDASAALGVEEGSVPSGTAVSFRLFPPYPNPFNMTTNINFNITRPGWTRLAVYDILGREVEVLKEGYFQPGDYYINWNARGFASGIYLIKLYNGGNVEVKPAVLVK